MCWIITQQRHIKRCTDSQSNFYTTLASSIADPNNQRNKSTQLLTAVPFIWLVWTSWVHVTPLRCWYTRFVKASKLASLTSACRIHPILWQFYIYTNFFIHTDYFLTPISNHFNKHFNLQYIANTILDNSDIWKLHLTIIRSNFLHFGDTFLSDIKKRYVCTDCS